MHAIDERPDPMYTMHFFQPLFVVVFFVVPFGSSGEIHSLDQLNFLSDVIVPLANHKWRLRSDDGVFKNLEAKVPGDLLSDLMLNGMIICHPSRSLSNVSKKVRTNNRTYPLDLSFL